MGLFDRLFKKRDGNPARRAELAGELARAVELWMDAGRPDEAARVMILRGDAEPDPKLRLQHYTQAAATAPVGATAERRARVKKALLTVVLAGDAAVSTAARRDLIEAAQELEAMGEPQRAAEAYELAKDPEGEARALAKAGDVDKLETVLFAEEQRQHKERARRDAHAEIEMLVSCGKRREALTVASQLARAEPDDHEAREKVHSLDGRRAKGAVLRVVLRGRACSLVLGESVVVGRTEGALTVPSHAISRRHLVIQRDAGRTTVCDLSSRNGTQLRGMSIAGAMDVGDGLELKLGHAVPLGIAPSAELGGAMAIELGGERYLAPLGPCRLGIGAWRLEVAADDWVELVTSDDPPAFLGPLSLAPRVTLLVGDSIASARGDEPVLRVVG